MFVCLFFDFHHCLFCAIPKMVHNCSVVDCTSYAKKGSGLQFFGFPLKNEELLKKWIFNIRRRNFSPNKSSKLCSIHFREEDYLVRPGTYIRRLKPYAVPTVFPMFPLHLQRKISNQYRILNETPSTSPTDKDPIVKQEPSSNNPKSGDIPKANQDVMEANQVSNIDNEIIHVSNRLDKGVQTENKLVIVKSTLTDIDVPKRLNKKVQTRSKSVDKKTTLKIRALQDKVRRQNRRIEKLKDLVKMLRNDGFLQQKTEHSIKDQCEMLENITIIVED